MRVLSLTARGFRNLEDLRFAPHEGLNVVYGENAQGKTNLLEAMWLFTGGRSFRGAKDAELVRFGEEEASLALSFFSQEREQEAELVLRAGARRFTLNGVPQRSGAALVGRFCAVVFSPEHLSLVKGGPAERRAFLDSALCQVRPQYAAVFARYRHTLNQRNALLKDIARHPELLDTLSIWDERLCRYGEQLVRDRKSYLERLAPIAAKHYEGISGGREALEVFYEPSFRESMAKELFAAQREDLRNGHTSVGPHRDDLGLRLAGAPARMFASQGQQRSIVLALKLAEAAVLALSCGEEPVVFLDDVLSELDAGRQEYLLRTLGGRQVFLTGCGTIPPAGERGEFQVSQGVVSPRGTAQS